MVLHQNEDLDKEIIACVLVEGSNPSLFSDLPDISNMLIARKDCGGKCIASVLIQICITHYIVHPVLLILQATVFSFKFQRHLYPYQYNGYRKYS